MSEIKGFDELMAKIDRLTGAEFEAVQEKGALSLAQAHAKAAKSLAPVDSGELRNSIHETVEREPGAAIGITYTNSDHAAYVEFGTGPVGAETNKQPGISHSMGPFKHVSRSGKVFYRDYWTYFDPVRQQFFSTRGQPAQPYMYPAAQIIRKQAGSILAQAAEKFFKGGG